VPPQEQVSHPIPMPADGQRHSEIKKYNEMKSFSKFPRTPFSGSLRLKTLLLGLALASAGINSQAVVINIGAGVPVPTPGISTAVSAGCFAILGALVLVRTQRNRITCRPKSSSDRRRP
jgi:hypothetical protein